MLVRSERLLISVSPLHFRIVRIRDSASPIGPGVVTVHRILSLLAGAGHDSPGVHGHVSLYIIFFAMGQRIFLK